MGIDFFRSRCYCTYSYLRMIQLKEGFSDEKRNDKRGFRQLNPGHGNAVI